MQDDFTGRMNATTSARVALFSVYDKTDIAGFARFLCAQNFDIVASGGTRGHLENEGIQVTDISDFTGSPEVMAGRVKTLSPQVSGGILAQLPKDGDDLATINGRPIDVVVCNLYPFQSVVASGAGDDKCIENIDVGGPTMVRAAAKNHARVFVATTSSDYRHIEDAMVAGDAGRAAQLRRMLAAQAFQMTADYEAAIATWCVNYAAPNDKRASNIA